MTTWIIGAVIGLFVLRQLRESFTKQLHTTPSKGKDLRMIATAAVSSTKLGAAGGMLGSVADADKPAKSWGGKIRWVVSVGVRLAFILWLYDITDGAAFSPFAFMSDLPGGPVWHVAVIVLGLTEVLGRVGAGVFRAVARRKEAQPATAEPVLTG